jgi:DNA polymerase-3 subunit epsilon
LGYYKGNGCNDQENIQDQRLPPNLPREDFEQLPENQVSIIFIMNLKVIYVGKAVNLKNE